MHGGSEWGGGVYDAQGNMAAEYGPATDSGTKYVYADALGSTRLEARWGGRGDAVPGLHAVWAGVAGGGWPAGESLRNQVFEPRADRCAGLKLL